MADDFSAEDLSLIRGTDEGATEAAGKGEQHTDAKQESDAGKGAPEAKSEDKPAAKDIKRASTIVDDIDGNEGEAEGKETKDAEGKDRPAEKPKDEPADGKWRERVIDKILKDQEGKLTKVQLDKRRESLMNDLKRSVSLEDEIIRGIAARQKIRSGEYRAKLGDDASEEEVAAWREENGIPKEAKAYEIPKVAGYKWTDGDQPLIGSFKEYAHKGNYTQTQMDLAAEWYAKTSQDLQEQAAEAIARTDSEDSETIKDRLRAEVGPAEFKPTLQIMKRLLDDPEIMPGGLGHYLLISRYPDDNGVSRKLFNNEHMVRFLRNIAEDTYGPGSMVSGDARTSAGNRRAELEKLMETNIDEYYRSGAEKELRELMEQEEQSGSRRRRAA